METDCLRSVFGGLIDLSTVNSLVLICSRFLCNVVLYTWAVVMGFPVTLFSHCNYFVCSHINKYISFLSQCLCLDLQTWLKGLRLHKYTHLFQSMTYERFIAVSDAWLVDNVSPCFLLFSRDAPMNRLIFKFLPSVYLYSIPEVGSSLTLTHLPLII
jgi:hypothetical protein